MKIIAVTNQKGGVGKSTTTASIGIGLAREGAHVLLVDNDPQGNLTQMLGWQQPDEIKNTLAEMMMCVMDDRPIAHDSYILHNAEGVGLIPSNIGLSTVEQSLVNAISRETILRACLEPLKRIYDYILIDCPPSLGALNINALSAANSVIIPVATQFLPSKGLEDLLKSISKVRRHLNPSLGIDGILLTMTTNTKSSRHISEAIRAAYGDGLHVYDTEIPTSVKAAEMSAAGESIYMYNGGGKVAAAYTEIIKEVEANAKTTTRNKTESVR